MYAAEEHRVDVARVLIKYGADVNFIDQYGVTPLIATAYPTHEYENPASFEITKMLVEAGADVNIVSRFGETAIGGAVSLNDDLARLKYLVENGGNIKRLRKSGGSYMYSCGSIECYSYFLDLGFDINLENDNGKSILQGSLYLNSDMEQTKQLLAWGADICHKDNSGDTVLEHVERQRTFPHDKKENPESYRKKVQENRNSEMYNFLKVEYGKQCLG